MPTSVEIEVIRRSCTQYNEVQWLDIIDRTLYHGVFPAFNHCLQNNVKDLLPDNIKTKLSQASMDTTMQSMRLTGELVQINRQLNGMGIKALAFKGPALAKIAYGDINQRQFSDLDIFIKRTDFRKVIPLMEAKGFQALFPIEKFIYDKVMFEMNNDCGFYKQQKNILVEFHWDFFRKLAISTDKFAPWADTETIVIDQFEITTLKPETHLLYHSLHGSKHVWERLFWILDLDRFIRAHDNLEWDELLTKSSSMGAQKMFLLGIALAIKYFDTPVPAVINQRCQAAKFENVIAYVENEFGQENP
ncbi:MAG: nucleotidyltransferase family protein, partial [Proteobacteria bacterium]|nr:nucleotidyltransferase family protein [Pseudomonadota bacterium]